MQSLYERWKSLPESWRLEIQSAWHTFVAAFILTIGTQVMAGDVQWTGDMMIAVLLAALRSGVKAVFVWIYSQVKAKPQ